MKSIKLLITIIFTVVNPMISLAQESSGQNELDSLGNKTGFWSQIHDGQKTQCYYCNGKLNGSIKTYYKNGELFYLGFYKNDSLCGKAFWFDEKGRMIIDEDNILINDFYIINANKNKIRPHYKSYYKSFYPSGNVESEGIMLYDESPLFESIEYGKWIYYNENGGVKSVVNFKDKALIYSEH